MIIENVAMFLTGASIALIGLYIIGFSLLVLLHSIQTLIQHLKKK